MEFLSTVLIIFGVFASSMILINLRYWVQGKEFRGTCASRNNLLNDKLGDCPVCGKSGDEVCKMPEVKPRP